MGVETILATVALGAAGFGASKAFGGGKKESQAPSPQPLPAPPTTADAASDAEKQAKRRRKATTRTIYTDPLGLSGQADVVRKTLTGQ